MSGPREFDTTKALAKALDKAAREVRGLDEASAELGATLVGVARTKVPRDTGALAGSIAFRVNSRPVKGTDTTVTVTAGDARVVYSGPIHWGWPARGIAASYFLVDPLGRMADTDTIADTYAEKVSQILESVL